MKKSKQVELIADEIQNKLQEVIQFPKMYHTTDDSISIPMVVDNKKVVVEIKSI